MKNLSILFPMNYEKKLNSTWALFVEGNLCPYCQMRLDTEFNGHIEEMPIERILLSEATRRGIGTFSPSDPKSQDIADLTGSIDFSTITRIWV